MNELMQMLGPVGPGLIMSLWAGPLALVCWGLIKLFECRIIQSGFGFIVKMIYNPWFIIPFWIVVVLLNIPNALK